MSSFFWHLNMQYFKHFLHKCRYENLLVFLHLATRVLFISRSAFKDPSKSFIPSEQAFDVPSYVLRHMMRGQKWVEGNADYHQRYVKCPVMLIHGEDDALVTVHEEQDMEEVKQKSNFSIVGCVLRCTKECFGSTSYQLECPQLSRGG